MSNIDIYVHRTVVTVCMPSCLYEGSVVYTYDKCKCYSMCKLLCLLLSIIDACSAHVCIYMCMH